MPFHIFGHRDKSDLPGTQSVPNSMATSIALPEDQRAQLASDLSMLDKADISRSQRLQKDVERSVIAAADMWTRTMPFFGSSNWCHPHASQIFAPTC